MQINILSEKLSKHFKQIFFLTGYTLIAIHTYSQSIQNQIYSEFNTLVGSKGNMPFYFWANRMGQIPIHAGTLFLGSVSANGQWYSSYQRYGIETGFRAVKATGDADYTRFIEAYGKFSSRHIIFGGGLFADSIQQRGLSVSNGNFFSGQNAEPYFRIKLSTNGFIPIGDRNFSIAALWEEGHTGKYNFVKNALLHHKYLLFKFGTPQRLEFTWGIDHYAYWSGKSPVQGYLPSGFTDYIRTVLSLPGGKEANISDQNNVQGNQLGQYYFIFRKAYSNHTIEARLVHLFEDVSGMLFVNAADNLYSVSIDFDNPVYVDQILIEFYHTKHQSGDDIDRKTGQFRHRNGRDNYFNHGTYRSGYSHNGFIIGSPLFYPLNINSQEITTGVANNRFMAIHAGISGSILNRALQWRTMLTGSVNSGTYATPFEPGRNQFSALAEAKYHFKQFPGWLGTSFAIDRGNLMAGDTESRVGIMLTAGWKLN
jgi:hypothetical protein